MSRYDGRLLNRRLVFLAILGAPLDYGSLSKGCPLTMGRTLFWWLGLVCVSPGSL